MVEGGGEEANHYACKSSIENAILRAHACVSARVCVSVRAGVYLDEWGLASVNSNFQGASRILCPDFNRCFHYLEGFPVFEAQHKLGYLQVLIRIWGNVLQ